MQTDQNNLRFKNLNDLSGNSPQIYALTLMVRLQKSLRILNVVIGLSSSISTPMAALQWRPALNCEVLKILSTI